MILKALEQSSGTFTDLRKRTKLADSTLSYYLKELEDHALIEREYKRPNLLIKLSAKALDPVQKTLRHLEELVPPPSKLDIELGQKLLTKQVVDTMEEIYRTRFRPIFAPEEFSKLSKLFGRSISFELEFNETVFITVLAYYHCEMIFPNLQESPKAETLGKPVYTPAGAITPILKNKGLIKQFDALLEWAKPLLQTSSIAAALFTRGLIEHYNKLHDFLKTQKEGGEKK
jgi:DNA-binding transcriptional ArsR family regulator